MKKSANPTRPRVIGMVATVCAWGHPRLLSPRRRRPQPIAPPAGSPPIASGVLAEAGGYLGAHPGANNVLTAAATQAPEEARANVRGYFMGNPGEFLDLQRIAGPLKDLRNQCGIAVGPGQLATLFETMSEG